MAGENDTLFDDLPESDPNIDLNKRTILSIDEPRSYAEQADEAKKAIEDETYGTLGQQIQTGIETGLSAATFGATDMGISSDSRLAEETLKRREINPGAAFVGELGGSLLPISGPGLAAARGAQWVSRGTSAANRIFRTVAVEGTTGVAQEVGDYLGQQSLRGNKVTVDGVTNAAIRGGTVGSIAGGVGYAAGKGVKKLGDKINDGLDGRIGKLADDSITAQANRAAGIDVPSARSRRIDEVLNTKADDIIEADRGLMSKVDDIRNRDLEKDISDVLDNPTYRATTSGDDGLLSSRLEKRLRKDAQELDRARNAASDWANRYRKALDDAPGSDIAEKQLKIPKELDDEGAIHLARLDEARHTFDSRIRGVKDKYIAPKSVDPTINPVDQVSLPELSDIPQPKSLFERGREFVETGLGALETAEDVGLPVPSLSSALGGTPFGEALGLWVKMKAGARALRKAGVLPETATVRTAADVNTLQRKVQDKLNNIVKKVKPKQLPRVNPSQIANISKQISLAAMDGPSSAEAMNAKSSLSFDEQLAMQAESRTQIALNYLAEKSPKNPLLYEDRHKPNPIESAEYQRRVATVMDPDDAIEKILHDPSSIIEVEALKAVYPDLANEIRDYLALNAVDLSTKLTEAQKQFLGRSFGIPLSITQIPGYAAKINNKPEAQGNQRSARPSNANASPLASTEEVKING